MRVAIDGSAIPPAMAGAGVYTCQLARALAALSDGPELVVFAREGLFDDLRSERFRVIHTSQMSPAVRLVWEQTSLPRSLRRGHVDVLHSPHHHTPLLPSRNGQHRAARVVTVHDVTFMLLPGRYPLLRRLYMEAVTRASMRIADAIIVPSEAVRDDLRRVIDRNARVAVVPEAAGPQYRAIEDERAIGAVRERYGLGETFLLSVGSLEPGKNRGRLIAAFKRLARQDIELVIVGQPAWRYEREFDLVNALGLEARVRFLGYVPDADMPAIYNAATAFAFPSLYEGFGLPVLEAMACGTPVVTSDRGATAEIAGDAALLVDPRDVTSMVYALSNVLADEALRHSLRQRGLERAAQFSWERAARETLSVYEVASARF
jgi:glycosyltransferase involved in cell wall biosynthesis